jgi:hypothetical protein
MVPGVGEDYNGENIFSTCVNVRKIFHKSFQYPLGQKAEIYRKAI